MAEILDLDVYDGKLTGLSEAASIEIENLIERSSGITDLDLRRRHIQDQIPIIAEKYEQSAATSVSDIYDEWREETFGKSFNGLIGESDLEPVIASTRSLTYPFKDAAERNLIIAEVEAKVRDSLVVLLDRIIKSKARYTMLDLVEQDDAEIGCASIPQGATTCAFCLSMAAVGFAKSFEVLEEEGRTFHDHCDCRFIPGPIGQSVKLSDYNSDAVQNALNDAKRTLGYPTDKKLKPEWERAIRAELERRDSKWVMEGVVPEIDSEPKELLDFIRKDRPHEERTALRLALRGYKSTFAPDTIERFDELKGMMQTIGLADTKQGIEFKTIMVAKEESTIDDYLRKAAKKEGVKLLVFDTYESKYLSDTKIVEFVSNNMRKRGISEVLVIMKDGSLRYIKK